MQIHQIQARYVEVQDRILLRISTNDACEFRFWLTRRYSKGLGSLLLRMLEQDQPVQQQVDKTARREVLAMRHEGFVQQGNFSRQFEEREYRFPLGEEPLLCAVAQVKPLPGGLTMLSMRPEKGQGLDLKLEPSLLHTFSKLLRDAIRKSDWGLDLGIPVSAAQPVADTSAIAKH